MVRSQWSVKAGRAVRFMAERAIIDFAEWLKTPAGRYVLQWEQAQIDTVVADVFGFHALQLGLPELETLRANRMPHRWVAAEAAANLVSTEGAASGASRARAAENFRAGRAIVALHCDFDALPFDANSLDLVVLPHALELARDPHLALREVERVLMPEGRVVIIGFNPSSLWGVRQRLSHWCRRFSGHPHRTLFVPSPGEFLGFRRVRDWLRLLSFEVEAGQFGCYAPPFGSQKWLTRVAQIEPFGDRWWPVLGAVYLVVAVKRVRGMRLVGLAQSARRPANPVAAPASASVTRLPTAEVAHRDPFQT